MKSLITAILIFSLILTVSCGKQEKSASDAGQTVQPPDVSLHIAALQGNVDAIQQHIKAGSDLNEIDEYGSTPLIVAVTFGKTEAAKALIEAGADMTISNNEESTPLHIAAFLCRTEIVRALLDKGADKSAKNKAGSTPLDTVAGSFEDVKAVYDGIGKALKPLGLRLDYDQIKKIRPQIAEMLRQN
jgi:hypothetical protein